MRLVNIGAGEIADRLTILALKIAYGLEGGKDVAHFIKERNALVVQFRNYELAPLAEALFELAAVNAMLWHAEDDLRELRDTPENPSWLSAAGAVGFRIQALNDRRAALVWTLNKAAGTDRGREKL